MAMPATVSGSTRADDLAARSSAAPRMTHAALPANVTRKARRLRTWLLLACVVRSNKPDIAFLRYQKNTEEGLSAGAATGADGPDLKPFGRRQARVLQRLQRLRARRPRKEPLKLRD